MRNVGLFASSPWWLWHNLSIGTAIDNRYNHLTEAVANLLTCRSATLVFDGIVQQGRNSLVLVATILKNNTGHPQQMSNIWNIRPFTPLSGMQLRSKKQGLLET